MLSLPITGLYAGLLSLVLTSLAFHVGGARSKARATLATDTTPALTVAVRRFGNFVEWVPFVLLLLAVAELDGLPHWLLHGCGAALVLARILHPLGLRHDRGHPLRIVGALTTTLVAVMLGIALIWRCV